MVHISQSSSTIGFGLLALAILAAQAPTTGGAKILAVYAFAARSHFMMHQTLIKELVMHGHQVTMITAITLEPLKLGSNYTEILIEPVCDFSQEIRDVVGSTTVYDTRDISTSLKVVEFLGQASTEHALKQPKVQEIINAKQTDGVFDLLLVEQFFQESFLALAHVYNIPVVSSGTFGLQLTVSQMFGIVLPWSYVPHGFLPLTDRMSFWERVYNTYYALYTDLDREFVYFPKMDAIVQKYFGHLPIKFPSVSAMEKNLSAIFINTYTPISTAGPTAENIINIGGVHIYPPKPLPADIQNFLDGAEHGVIYFSFGTILQSKDMPPEKLQIFFDVFRQLKQRVLWKFENESIPNLPDNVMTKKWLPQSDILAHPNVRVFISHGGLFGTQEAVYFDVPILGIPFFSDQSLNMKKAEVGGYGIALDIRTLTRAILKQSVHELLTNTTYRNNIKRASSIFRDRPMGPRETFLYWIDYVIRHNGARHLRAAGMDLKWYQFYLLDVAALVVASIAAVLGLSVLSMCWILRIVKGGKSKQKPSKLLLVLLALTILVAQASPTDGARILAVYVFAARSHFMMHQNLIKELVMHGHQVTMITGLTLEPLKLGSNYTEILIEPVYDYWKEIYKGVGEGSVYDMEKDFRLFLNMLPVVGIAATEHALRHPKIQPIINAKQAEGVYDLMLVEQFYQDAFLALARIYNIPVVSSAAYGQQHYMSRMFAIVAPWSYVPNGFLPLSDRMSFWERMYNSYYALWHEFKREFEYFPVMDAFVQKYFGHLPIQFPSASVMGRNISAIMINAHTPLSTPRPTIDNMINIGGVHIYPPNPLPLDIQNFLDGAEHGVIYFSLGTQVQGKDMPPEKAQIFLDVFRRMKQRVLWKFENESIPNLPDNVMIKKWLPQSDILAHTNVRVFIAHGGLFGTQEAVYHGVPILGMPFFFDQRLNIMKAELGGYGLTLNYGTLTRATLTQGLHELLTNTTYRNNIKRASSIFRDRPMGPRETFLYWIDYVIRHNGARHLRAAGMDLKWYQFYLLDVAALVVASIAAVLGLSVLLMSWILRSVKGGKSKQKVQ